MENEYESYDCLGCRNNRSDYLQKSEQNFEYNFLSIKSINQDKHTNINNKLYKSLKKNKS